MAGALGIIASARVAPAGLTGTFLQAATDATDLTTYTFASQNLGSASSDRVIAVAVSGRNSSARTISSVTIGGVSATEVGTRGSSQNPLGIWTAAVPTGTTGSIVVTFSSGVLRCVVAAWSVKGGALFDNANSGTTTATVTGISNGFIIAAANTTGSSTFTWTNATERYDGITEAFNTSAADATTVGSTTITATPTIASTNGVVAVALKP